MMGEGKNNISDPDPESGSRDGQSWLFRLYIAGAAPNSIRAIANLHALGREYLAGNYDVEIVDILEDPLRAIADEVLVTPTLVKLSPGPASRVVGNLNQRERVLLALGLGEDAP